MPAVPAVPAVLTVRRGRAASLAAGALGACALIALVDPEEGGPYPLCPTQALLGIDCPACGTLRGLHALSRGRFAEALDHNLLLLVAVPVGLLTFLGVGAAALGRSGRAPQAARWVLPATVVVAAAFTVLRNLPGGPLPWLGSGV